MRVAIMSDIHGFDLALASVLADVAQQGEVAETIVAGDVCVVGPNPATVLDILRDRSFTVLTGNTDRDLVEAAAGGGADPADEAGYVLERIGPEGVRYLAGLPFSRRIAPPGGTSPADDLLVVHANPHDLDAQLHPDLSDAELRERIGATTAAVLAFGHVHIAYTRNLGGKVLVDVSAVGNPKDGDLRAKWGLFTWDAEAKRWDVELRRVPYPIDATVAQIRASDLPNPERTIRKLLKASY